MDIKISKIGDELMSLTTAEALELQKYLESKGLVIAQQVSVQEKKEEIVEETESENVNVVLTKAGTSLIKLAKALMPKIGKSAVEIKKMVDALPAIVFENIPRTQGVAFLSEVGNEIDLEEYGLILKDI
jgi:ribosomal protein L7/L12